MVVGPSSRFDGLDGEIGEDVDGWLCVMMGSGIEVELRRRGRRVVTVAPPDRCVGEPVVGDGD